ncbi:MAG: sensor histidine kinase [Candidatus Poribacteria bacterium]|nr:sensor histidine kinase [Candidatus Poribacteria bacterium]
MNDDVTYKIRPAGRHILTIGKDLIQDNYAAVVELVKNAYDADSPDVNIEFKKSLDRIGHSIVISDHGHGMDREDVINKWLVPSTEDKIKRHSSPNGRPLQGNKGVGRYAASILGEDMLLETVNLIGEKTTAYLQWKDFEKAEYLDDVPILIETTEVTEQHGTRLTINMSEEHINRWDKKTFRNLQYELKKLKSPVSAIFNSDEFNINLTVDDFPHDLGDHEETIEPYVLFELFDYKISGKISEDGKGTLTYSSQKAPNMVEEKIEFDLKEPTGCGELDIDIRVYDRDSDALDSLINRGLRDGSGKDLGKAEVKRLLDAYNGIGVYRNGFRIRPLGDPGFDWLKLNSRRVNMPTRCISSNQAIGYVQIQSDKQSKLIEKSARDGLKENEAFDQLNKVTMRVILQLEMRRYEYRRKEDLNRPTLEVERNLKDLGSLNELKKNVRKQLTKDKVKGATTDEIMDLINQEEDDKNKKVEKVSRVVAIYQGQATLGKIVNVIHHEGRHALGYFRDWIPYLRRRYKLFKENRGSVDFEKVMEVVNGIANNAELLRDLFKKIDPLATGRGRARKTFKLKQAIQQALVLFESEMETKEIFAEIEVPDDFSFSGWDQDIRVIFTNLIDNSVYWISEMKVPIRKITIELKMDGDSLDSIHYRDTGPGIKSEHIRSEVIFEPDFSTKTEGTGLGLAIAGEAAERNGLRLKAVESEDGAHFILEPKTEDQN